jgi:mannose-6-phosphate isomerase-like protein (cupin superfamily)
MQWRFAAGGFAVAPARREPLHLRAGCPDAVGSPHRVQEEAYVVVGGSGRAKLDDEVVELLVWDVLRVAPAVVRSFEAGPEGLEVICIGGRKPKEGTRSGSTTSGLDRLDIMRRS